MSFWSSVAAWLIDPAHWGGSDGIPTRVIEHVVLSAASTTIAAALALPLAIYLGHTRRFNFAAVNVANVGRALPSLALLAFALPVAFALGLGLHHFGGDSVLGAEKFQDRLLIRSSRCGWWRQSPTP